MPQLGYTTSVLTGVLIGLRSVPSQMGRAVFAHPVSVLAKARKSSSLSMVCLMGYMEERLAWQVRDEAFDMSAAEEEPAVVA